MSVRVEPVIARLLFWGGTVSILLVLAGLALHMSDARLYRPPTAPPARVASPAGDPLTRFASVGAIAAGLIARPFEPLAVSALGLVMLFLTPVAGVAVAIPLFLAGRDYRYAAVASAVLVMLMLSLFFSGHP